MDSEEEWNDDNIEIFDFFSTDTSKPTKPVEVEIREPSPISVDLDNDTDTEIDYKPKKFCHSCGQEIGASNRMFYYESNSILCQKDCLNDLIRKIYDTINSKNDFSCISEISSFESIAELLKMFCKEMNSEKIFQILKYLKDNLSSNIFLRLLKENKMIYYHYLSHLICKWDHNELECFSKEFKNDSNTKMIRMNQLIKSLYTDKNSEIALQNLIVFSHTGFSGPYYEVIGRYIREYVDLYKYQDKYTPKWSVFIQSLEYEEMHMKYPDRIDESSLHGISLAETIDSITLLENSIEPNGIVLKMKSQFNIKEDQFIWIVLEPLIMRENWMALDEILFERKLLSRKTSTFLTPDRLVMKLHSLKVPFDYLQRCLMSIDDIYILIDVCLKLCLHQFILQHIVKLKNNDAMKYLHESIPTNIPEYKQSKDYIETNVKTWK